MDKTEKLMIEKQNINIVVAGVLPATGTPPQGRCPHRPYEQLPVARIGRCQKKIARGGQP